MSRDRPRRFNLLDMSIIVAAVAIGLVQLRYILDLDLPSVRTPDRSPLPAIDRILLPAIDYVAPLIMSASLAALVISLRAPRPPLPRLARMPGFVALAVVAVSIAGYAVQLALRLVVNYRWIPSIVGTHYLWMLANHLQSTGWEVAVAWLVLALQGNWRRRPFPPESVGIPLGWALILIDTSMSIYNMIKIWINHIWLA
jgi:hypothetical protein